VKIETLLIVPANLNLKKCGGTEFHPSNMDQR